MTALFPAKEEAQEQNNEVSDNQIVEASDAAEEAGSNVDVPSEEDLSSIADEAQEAATIEPVSGEEETETEDAQTELAQKLSEIEPAAGEEGSPSSSRGGFGFQSSFESQGVIALDDVGPIDPTALAYSISFFNDEAALPEESAPAGPNDIPVVEGDTSGVDETDLAPTTSVSGSVSADYGNDGPGSINGNGIVNTGGATSGGDTINVTFDSVTGTYTGTAGGDTIFTLEINSDGSYEFTLLGVIDHPDVTDHDDVLSFDFGFTGTDNDGDQASAFITININDDGPEIYHKFAQVDETDLANGPIGYTKTLNFDFGADGPGLIEPADNFFATFQVGGQNQILTSNGEEITVTTTADGYVGKTPNGDIIFDLTLNSQTGEYTYMQNAGIDHPDTTDPDDIIWSKFKIKITDADGDTDTAYIVVDVHDDGPEINHKFAAVDETDLVNGPIGYTKMLDFDFGADGPGLIEPADNFFATFQVGGQNQILTSNGEEITVTTTADGYVGKTPNGDIIFDLTLNSQTGEYTYMQNAGIDHPDTTDPDDIIWLKFKIKITDADGDVDTAYIVVDVHDDGPIATDDCVKFDVSDCGVSGDVTDNDTLSQDVENNVVQIKFAGQVFDVPADGSDITIDGDFGALKINSSGEYSYSLVPPATSSMVIRRHLIRHLQMRPDFKRPLPMTVLRLRLQIKEISISAGSIHQMVVVSVLIIWIQATVKKYGQEVKLLKSLLTGLLLR